MATDPRAALDRLVGALEAHLTASERRRSDSDPGVEAAYAALADAFEVYDEALYAAYDEVTPLELFDDAEDDEDDDDGPADEDDAADDDGPDVDLVDGSAGAPGAAGVTSR